MIRFVATLTFLALLSLAAVGTPIFADGPPVQPDELDSVLIKDHSKVSLLLRETVQEFQETGSVSQATLRGEPDGNFGETEDYAGAPGSSSKQPNNLVRFDGAGNVQVYIHLTSTGEDTLE